jgi:hypothetical protein
MCPGLTSAGGALDKEVPADAPVVCALSPIFSFLFELRRKRHPNLFFCQVMLILNGFLLVISNLSEFAQAIMAEGKQYALAIGLSTL